MGKFAENIGARPYVIYVPGFGVGNSNRWATDQAIALLNNKPIQVIYQSEFDNRAPLFEILEDTDVFDIVLFDDTIYTGDQMQSILYPAISSLEGHKVYPHEDEFKGSVLDKLEDKFRNDIRVHLIVPYIALNYANMLLGDGAHMSPESIQPDKFKNMSENLYFYPARLISSLGEQLQESFPGISNELEILFWKTWNSIAYARIDIFVRSLPIWFQHRIPDSTSSPFALMASTSWSDSKHDVIRSENSLWEPRKARLHH